MNIQKISKVIGSAGLVVIGQKAEDGTGYTRQPTLTLFNSSGVDDGAYYPAQDFTVYGEEAIRDLRDFCHDLLLNKTV